jgi:hypothetical protein
MPPLSTGPWPHLKLFLVAGFGCLNFYPALSLAGDPGAPAVEKLDPVVVTEKKSASAVADEKLAKQVQQALRDDPVCYDYHIKVVVKDGVVVLTGFVTDATDMSDAIRISGKIPGVRRVTNTLELVGQGSDG